MKKCTQFVSILLSFAPVVSFGQNEKEAISPLKFEHLRINVADKEKTAKWYVENVGLEIIQQKHVI